MEQREVDNMLLSMIQKHFPSLPLSDEHTDWGKWLGFARAVYEAGRASPASVPEDWKLVPVEPTEEMLFKGHMEIDFDRNAQNTLELEHPSQTDDGGTSIRTDMTDAWVAMLAAAPKPECCRPVAMTDMRFVVCPDCGNKRCPRANDHRNACTGSNEPGQEGSAYPDAPKPQGG